MSTVPSGYVRHPLGLPPGSVRATLALMITGLFLLILALPASRAIEVPLFLYFLLSLLLVFVTAHGKTISVAGAPHPFNLPRATFRLLIVLGIIAVVGWRASSNPT